jgi:lipoate---protein ligase
MANLSIISPSNCPDFNLAAEEYFLKTLQEDVSFYYINDPSVIIGKHQNALAEINLPYLETHNIPLYRRLSGGGTVYHDAGNINYCFIKTGEASDLVNFKKATQPVVEVLNSWGVPVRSGQRNDLLIGYKKISGNACHVFKTRVMHHGTLLYNSNLDVLTESLKSDPLRYRDKAVKSVRSQVVNLKEALAHGWSTQEFLLNLEVALRAIITGTIPYTLKPNDFEAIEQLKTEKYSTWIWNYGYGPTYSFKKRIQSNGFVFAVDVAIVKGIIQEITLNTNYPNEEFNGVFSGLITGTPHEKKALLQKIEPLRSKFEELPHAMELIKLFF